MSKSSHDAGPDSSARSDAMESGTEKRVSYVEDELLAEPRDRPHDFVYKAFPDNLQGPRLLKVIHTR